VGVAPAVTIVTNAPLATGSITTVATVTHAGPDPLSTNDSDAESTLVTSSPDLSVALADAPDPARAEDVIEYTIEVTNNGTSASSGSVLTHTLPDGVTFLSSTPGSPACTPASGVVTCMLGTLPPANRHVVTVRATVDPTTLGTISSTASAVGSEPDPAGQNNDASTSTLVLRRVEAELVHGAGMQSDLAALGGAPDQDVYAIRVEPHKSYEVAVDATSGDIGLAQGPALERLAADGTTVLQSAVPSGAGPSRSLRWISTTSAPEDHYVRVRSRSCASDCGTDDVYRIRAWETTYRIPRFNNGASQVTIVLVQNTGSETVDGRMAFWSPTGTLVHEQDFHLAPRAVLSFPTADVPALAGQSGSVTISHDGPYGILAGKAVALEPASGFCFDSPHEPRTR
jgi:uncharacterized repeat protein (TIGR01451 family)